MNLSDLRRDFGKMGERELFRPQSPYKLITQWLKEAIEMNIPEANAMVLSTVGKNGNPSSRVVLLKEFSEEDGFVFYTDYQSRKGRELAENDRAALHFFWRNLERQILIEGRVKKLSREKSVNYFNSRPLLSRASATVSKQSSPIKNLDSLLEQRDRLLQQAQDIQCPERWGGYSLKAGYFEFWQGGQNRLHKRIAYRFVKGKWLKTYLAP